MTYDANGGKFTWDTSVYATQAPQLGTNQYTLSIADAELGMTGTSGAGYLNPLPMFTFGMYTPQPYTNYSCKSLQCPLGWRAINEANFDTAWVCATCSSGAMSLSEKQTWGFLTGMASITVLSFTWFATGRFGVL